MTEAGITQILGFPQVSPLFWGKLLEWVSMGSKLSLWLVALGTQQPSMELDLLLRTQVRSNKLGTLREMEKHNRFQVRCKGSQCT